MNHDGEPVPAEVAGRGELMRGQGDVDRRVPEVLEQLTMDRRQPRGELGGCGAPVLADFRAAIRSRRLGGSPGSLPPSAGSPRISSLTRIDM